MLLILFVGALGLAAASFLAALSYGHFARHARGEDMWALSADPAFTILDRGIGPRVEAQGGRSFDRWLLRCDNVVSPDAQAESRCP